MIKDNINKLLRKRREELKYRKELRCIYEKMLYKHEDEVVGVGLYSYLVRKLDEDIRDDELEIQFLLHELGCQKS